jgi:GNAT superfamily N-acetyltransferase
MAEEFEVILATDPRNRDLSDAGYELVAESWGARLRLSEPPDLDLTVAHEAVRRAELAGLTVRELDDSFAPALHALEQANGADYPDTPATTHRVLNEDDTRRLWSEGCRIFGALDHGLLVAATVIRHAEDRAETDFTSVLAPYRRRGIGTAVKAASIIALASQGVRLFGTGGARVNAASLGTNEALGYVIEERWLSYRKPAN